MQNPTEALVRTDVAYDQLLSALVADNDTTEHPLSLDERNLLTQALNITRQVLDNRGM